jgi:hypothetical protein
MKREIVGFIGLAVATGMTALAGDGTAQGLPPVIFVNAPTNTTVVVSKSGGWRVYPEYIPYVPAVPTTTISTNMTVTTNVVAPAPVAPVAPAPSSGPEDQIQSAPSLQGTGPNPPPI